MQILLFLAQQEGLTAKETATRLGMPTATVHHSLNTLVAEGLLAKDSQRRYHLGPAVGALADAYMRQTTQPEYLVAPLRQLAETTGESAYLSGWRGGDIVVLASAEGSHAVRVSELRHGYHSAAHARASGKLLLAYARPEVRELYLKQHPLVPLTPRTIVNEEEFETELKRTREQGYAVDEEEFKEGVACVSAPVVESGVVIAAYTLSSPVERFRQQHARLVDAVLAVAGSVGGRTSSLRAGEEVVP